MSKFRVQELVAWARERHNIYERRFIQKLPAPWTNDPIMQQYKFCNAFRELDRVTIWIRENWRTPCAADRDLWFAMTVARFLNWPEALEDIGYPLPWSGARRASVIRTLKDRKAAELQNFSGAYMVRSDPGDKIDYVVSVWDAMWAERLAIRESLQRGSLKLVYDNLLTYRGMGSFMAAQVIADLRYVAPLNKAKDLRFWAASGPGSRRGLARVMGAERMVPGDYRWPEEDWFKNFYELFGQVQIEALKVGLVGPYGDDLGCAVHGQDLQGWLCEYDKWCRVKNGEGRPRSKYPGQGV